MSFLYKTIGFMAVFSSLNAANAVTARPSVIGTASRRMPTMTAYISNGGTTTTVGGNTTTSTLLANAECIEAYTSCMKGADACGPNFEECTTNVLFHGKMPQCLSTLAQCSSAGVSSLFGTSSVSALSTIKTKNSYGEVTAYTYPTDGSVLGQLITGAAISNRYDTPTCVRRYTSCLKKDSVCGSDFELCTTDSEFRKQRVFCDSTLARCQSDGLIELFGSTNTTTAPSATSRVGEMIAEGAALAAVNAVSTCYKVVDQCILNACTANPYKCYENSTQSVVNIVEAINNNNGILTEDAANALMETITKGNISAYIKNSCLNTIGANKYCYATFLGNGQMPTASQLRDEDNQEEIYDEAYSARMNAAMKAKISDLVDAFDTKAKNKCSETIQSCVMHVCGSGSGAACYSQVFGSRDKSINNSDSYDELKTGCGAIVNTDAYCKYAAANPNSTGTYSYNYINSDAFDILFPTYEEGKDPIGVVAALNAKLASSYSDAAIATMKRQCQSVATSCVKSLCGTDYQNCYRNRTDVYSSLTDTGDSSFDKSMNKVGGVLDYTIVLGLCLDTVKNATVCEEHLAIERNKLKMSNNTSASSWGSASNVREGWIDAGGATAITAETERVASTDENGNPLCTSKAGSGEQVCYTVDSAGNIYDQPVYISYTTYIESQAASTLFKDLIYDLEKEAQAKYNAKLTKQQNLCMSSNTGGVMGNRDSGSTFMWVKLKSNKVPAAYPTAGLKSTQFAASNDIYNSFCRVRITLQSDDKQIQDVISKGVDWATAYFAAGDSFTCGSWIPGDKLEELANAVAQDARSDASRGNSRVRSWMSLFGVLGGGGLGAWGGSAIANSNFLGGLTSRSQNTSEQAESCANYGSRYLNATDNATRSNFATKMLAAAYKIDTRKAPKKSSADAAKLEQARSALQQKIAASSGASITNNSTVSCNYYDTLNAANAAATAEGRKAYQISGSENYVVCAKSEFSDETTVDLTIDTTNVQNGSPVIVNKSVSVSGTNSDVTQAVLDLQNECANWDDKGVSAQKTKAISTAIGTGVGAVAGGILAYQATKSVQNAKLEKAEQEAYDAWMNEVGQHIRCYIGGDEVGMYGDIISTSME